jgi:hypothetical protein
MADFGAIAYSRWSAQVGGSWRNYWAWGLEFGDTQSAADSAAVSSCKIDSSGNNCTVIYRWHYGCAYMAAGAGPTGMNYAVATTKAAAAAQCAAGGYNCEPPDGDCAQ